MSRLSRFGVLVAAVALAGAGCNSDSTTTPTTPTPVAITETFSGTLGVNAAVTFPFSATQGGSANAVLKAVQPDLVVTVNAGGTGTFSSGETVYQGPADTATWQATVDTWLPGSNKLVVRGVTGSFTAEGAVSGLTSKAVWTAKSTEATTFGMALGTWSGTTCSVVLANDVTGIGGQVTGIVQTAGSLCARIYDTGKLVTPITFTIEVTHF